MTRRDKRRAQLEAEAGFTLIEVMIALLILGLGLGVLLGSAGGNLAATRKAEMWAVATELGRSKMYDLEEKLLEEGFQQLDQELDGDFDDEGWEDITWQAKIEKIELPNLEALSAVGQADSEGEGGAGGGANILSSMLGFLPPGLGAGGAGAGLDASAAAGAGLLATQYELISGLLEESIRKVKLTIKWKRGRFDGELVLDAYFTEPAAISRSLGGLAGLAGGSGGSSRGGSSSDDSGSNNSNNARSNNNNIRGGQ